MMYFNCLKILETCCEAGLIKKVNKGDMTMDKDGNYIPVPEESVGRILIYHAAGETDPEGWYAEDIDDAAQDLMKDRAGQRFLLHALSEKGIKPDLIDERKFHRETEEMLSFWEGLSNLPSWSN